MPSSTLFIWVCSTLFGLKCHVGKYVASLIVPIYKKWKFICCYLWSTFYRFGSKVKSLSSHFLNSPLKFGRVSISCNELRFCQPQLIPRKIWLRLVNKYLQETNTCLDVRFTLAFALRKLLSFSSLLIDCYLLFTMLSNTSQLLPHSSIHLEYICVLCRVFRKWWFLPYLWISEVCMCTHIHIHMAHLNFNQISIIILYVFCYLNSSNDYAILMRLEKNNFFPLLFRMVILFASDD